MALVSYSSGQSFILLLNIKKSKLMMADTATSLRHNKDTEGMDTLCLLGSTIDIKGNTPQTSTW